MLAKLRSLLQCSELFNFDDNTAADTFFSLTDRQNQCDQKEIKNFSALSQVIAWFPSMALDQIQNHLNLVTFKIENISPNDKHPEVLISNDMVKKWIASNNSNISLTPAMSSIIKPGKLVKLTPELDIHPFYGLIFDRKEQNM